MDSTYESRAELRRIGAGLSASSASLPLDRLVISSCVRFYGVAIAVIAERTLPDRRTERQPLFPTSERFRTVSRHFPLSLLAFTAAVLASGLRKRRRVEAAARKDVTRG